MAADVSWDFNQFVPRDVLIRLVGETKSGGRSLTGKLQSVGADAGYWCIRLSRIRLRKRADILAWDAMATVLQGKLGTVLLHIYQSKRAPWTGGVPGATIVASAGSAMAARATSGVIAMTTGADPEPGMYFSAGESLYRLATVTPSSGDLFNVTFRPPLREAIAEGDPLEFARPVCRCRLAADDGMAVMQQLQALGDPDVEFEEDV